MERTSKSEFFLRFLNFILFHKLNLKKKIVSIEVYNKQLRGQLVDMRFNFLIKQVKNLCLQTSLYLIR